ncbi:MAG TPA: hypothetical protein VFL16_11105 [Steroidobacteraceae bacterium]|jgi:hypothetical protein|nr:hypothetical protein [Steroidobacteraceae bacterium]
MRGKGKFRLGLAALCAVLGGCAKVAVLPEGDLPKPLVTQTPARVGVVVTQEESNYTHKESRASVDYEAQLGPSHKHLVEEIFRAEFADVKMFDSVDAARLESGLLAIFEPRIEQFSFASAKETGGQYCAVTIRYQIAIYAPNGEPVDTLTLTGYGSGPAPKIGNGAEELAIATYAAMRDAAAKFLTQFPSLDVAKPLLASQALQPKVQPVPGSPEAAAAEPAMAIEAVPINDTPVASTATPSSQAPSSSPAPAPPPASPPPVPPSQIRAETPATSL